MILAQFDISLNGVIGVAQIIALLVFVFKAGRIVQVINNLVERDKERAAAIAELWDQKVAKETCEAKHARAQRAGGEAA